MFRAVYDRAIHWLGRLTGAFFLALGLLLLYWGGRGLLDYRAGIRAPSSEPVAWAIALVAAALSLWVGARLVRSGAPPGFFGEVVLSERDAMLERAVTLERTDPAAARQLLDRYLADEEAASERRRAELRERSSHDLKAAIELRRDLRNEVSSNARFREAVVKNWPPSQRAVALTEIETASSRLQAEILQLDTTIAGLKRLPN